MEPAEPFAPTDVRWHAVSPRLATVERIVLAIVCGAVTVVLVVLAALLTPWIATGLVAVAAFFGWQWWLVGRQARAWGYAERDDDLLVRKGILFRSLVVVPYGRLQFVDVQAGPLDRRFGIAKVQLHTASPATDALIPGLVPEEAARLRDRLAARGEARLAGL
ncbi:PH domain-containing protein [Kineococcus gynurae]|uniref:PH domain-containing protein n=1 Tax=Kineococcus gynurae TaxID=452979 RepID=A0ABV5LTW5_9ACTN